MVFFCTRDRFGVKSYLSLSKKKTIVEKWKPSISNLKLFKYQRLRTEAFSDILLFHQPNFHFFGAYAYRRGFFKGQQTHFQSVHLLELLKLLHLQLLILRNLLYSSKLPKPERIRNLYS